MLQSNKIYFDIERKSSYFLTDTPFITRKQLSLHQIAGYLVLSIENVSLHFVRC